MKKTAAGIITAVLVITLGSTTAFAVGRDRQSGSSDQNTAAAVQTVQRSYTDTDQNGVCDYYEEGTSVNNGNCSGAYCQNQNAECDGTYCQNQNAECDGTYCRNQNAECDGTYCRNQNTDCTGSALRYGSNGSHSSGHHNGSGNGHRAGCRY